MVLFPPHAEGGGLHAPRLSIQLTLCEELLLKKIIEFCGYGNPM
jgi:hypothetical protein